MSLLELGGVGNQPLRQLGRTAESDEMPARHVVGLEAESLACDAALKLQRKEPIVAPDEDARGNLRPLLEATGRCEYRIRLAWLALGKGRIDERLRHIVKELDQRIERTIARLRLGVAGMLPPLARGFAGCRDHRIEKNEETNPHLLAHERCHETGERLRYDHQAARIPCADRADHGCGGFGQSCPVVGRRERYRGGGVSALLELTDEEVPVPGAAARAGHQDEVAPGWCQRASSWPMRIRLPAGSRSVNSRMPQGSSAGGLRDGAPSAGIPSAANSWYNLSASTTRQ